MAETKGFKYQITLQVIFRKNIGSDENKYSPLIYSRYLINYLDIDGKLETSYHKYLSRVQRWLGEGSRWIIGSIDGHYINTSIYNPLAGTLYMDKLPEKPKNSKNAYSI